MLKTIEPHHEHSQFVKLMSCHMDSVTRQMALYGFFLNASKLVTGDFNRKPLKEVPVV